MDDVILLGNNDTQINKVKSFLNNKFNIKDLGPLKYFLGIKVAMTSNGMVLSQRTWLILPWNQGTHTLDLLADNGLEGCRPSSFPMEQNARFDHSENTPLVDAEKYRRLIGRLLYLQVTRLDITLDVNILILFVSAPRQQHLDVTIRILQYLKTTHDQGIFMPSSGNLTLTAYCDSD